MAAMLAALSAPGVARADEPVAASEPRLLQETAETTAVVDAFDRENPFDLYIYAGFVQRWKRADIHRQTELNQPGLSTGGFVANTENVARYSQDVSTLELGADVGIFHDFGLTFRLPIILSDSRSLGDLNGSTQNPQRLQDPTGAQIFSVPFQSPTRSGIDYLSVGLAWAITNQQRDRTKPTWVIAAEGRFGVGDPLHACNATSGSNYCPDPVTLADGSSGARSPGISRAMYGLDIKTVISKRYGYIEPYTGFEALFETPRSDSDFGGASFNPSNIKGALVNAPPIIGTFTLGIEYIPWERREAFQRLVFDLRVQGMYSSAGRDYSELFDALGSSKAPSLRTPNPGAWTGTTPPGGSMPDPASQPVYFTGITDQSAFGAVGASGTIVWQAGQYVKFSAGGGAKFVESHVLTAADPCNPGIIATTATAGPCHTIDNQVTGIPDPNYHAIIDAPGRRFTVDNTIIGEFSVTATLMF